MENLELMSMTSFVLMQSDKMYTKIKERNGQPKYTVLQFITEIPNYAKFLTQTLTLSMLVPVDSDGNIIKEPKATESNKHWNEGIIDEVHNNVDWEIAKESVLFIGFENVDNRSWKYYQITLKKEYTKNQIDTIYTDDFGMFFYSSKGEKERLNTIEDLLGFHILYLSPSALKKIGI